MTESAAHPDPREELAELAAAVRAYVEWQADTGAAGLPIETAPGPLLASLGASAAPAGRAAAAGRPAFSAPSAHAPADTGRPAIPNFAAPAWSTPPAGAAQRPAAAASPARPPAEAAPRPAPAPPAPAPAPPAPAPRAATVVSSAAVVPAGADGSADERRTRLALLAEQVRSCTKCGLHEKRRQTVFSRGDPFAELCFVGEGPGGEEDAQGLPFVGPAGQLLDKMIAAMGYHRDAVYIANVVKCRPPQNRKPEPVEMATCMPYLAEQLGMVKPRVIVALGGTAMQGLCGSSEGITRLRGKWKLYRSSIPVMPTFHPAYLLRTPAAKREVWSDLQEVMKHLGKTPPAKGAG